MTAVPFLAGRGPDQVGIVVRDLVAALARYESACGGGPWHSWTYGPDTVGRVTYRGEPGRFVARIAIGSAVPQLELIESLAGPSLYDEHLEAHGEGLHHLGFWVPSVDEAIAEMASGGFACTQSGHGTGPDGDGGFAYFDTVAELGVILEAIERPSRRLAPELVYP
jgi:catechol 2,3-dioxygenase-like lactoylglutathione lyase family enzyme